ncbi:capsule biosynthesis protein [Pandoraea iniqua]|nr:capsule biosynthesis protein [Pandoraea iniqua]
MKAFTCGCPVDWPDISKTGDAMKIFTEHPASVGENYTQHLGSAVSFALPLLGAGLACLVHALLPFAFEKTGSKIIVRLHERMVTHRHRHGAAPAQAAQSTQE